MNEGSGSSGNNQAGLNKIVFLNNISLKLHRIPLKMNYLFEQYHLNIWTYSTLKGKMAQETLTTIKQV